MLDLVPAACHADALDLVDRIAQAGRVDHVHRHAFDLDRAADFVAGGAGNRGDDRELGPGQRVEQRALADVGLAGEHDGDAFAQQRALPRAVEHGVELHGNGLQPAAGVRLLQKVDLFFGEVERGLHEHAQLYQALTQRIDLVGKRAGQRAAGRACCGLGAGFDQVADGLGLREVELVVEERAFAELTGLSEAQARQVRIGQLKATRQQQLQHDRAAVGLQLEHVFAGVRVR